MYGTLRQGENNHHYLKGAERLASQAWVYGRLLDTGWGYPALLLQGMERVYGELYRVPHRLLPKIDELEDYTPGTPDNEYKRVTVTVGTDVGECRAMTYLYTQSLAREKEIPFGDWRLYHLRRRLPLLYFAYGSCMDDERFRLQGVADAFRERLGRGVLTGYDMRYTLSYPDGGRADLVEKKGAIAEGVVYRIGARGLDYLYWREGVQEGTYRPAMVSVEMKDGIHDALTFLVIDKKEETAPPEHYAREILRGSYGTVSDAYYQKLKRRLLNRFYMNVPF
ncbi:gamma-glutamylcyclotransferase [Desmospora activa]|uniref:gamma-glutamylcyclotransferase n=1 Tax=Desmospora activa TaxID=500615 RepID=UPI001FE854FF|nr:gamma-glutamylcyclotransferase family protein [Desmospora activa]